MGRTETRAIYYGRSPVTMIDVPQGKCIASCSIDITSSESFLVSNAQKLTRNKRFLRSRRFVPGLYTPSMQCRHYTIIVQALLGGLSKAEVDDRV
nr:hypothetical protein CFP56_10298 [Quercus suber]